MKKVFFTAAALFTFISSFSQLALEVKNDTVFKSRKLIMQESNLVSTYYHQNGSHAAVTGGMGSQKLTDVANVIDVSFVRYNNQKNKQTLYIEAGFDHYTSASSDMVDLQANTSASYADSRFYPSLTLTTENEKKGITLGYGLSGSVESDYYSAGANFSFAKKTNNGNGEFTSKFLLYYDQVGQIKPVELRNGYYAGKTEKNYSWRPRTTYNLSLAYSQIINTKWQLQFLADVAEQGGYLSLPFHRVYFNDFSVRQENLPHRRFKFPVAFNSSYFLGDKIILKTYYRFYTDDWGIRSHTANLEIPYKFNPFFSLSPFYRYYIQSASKFFAEINAHTSADKYYVSNYDLSKFRSSFFGANIRLAPPKGLLGNTRFTTIELRYGRYLQTTDLNANIISLHLQYK